MRPLYKSDTLPQQRRADGHAGLWFDKYFDRWPEDGSWKLSTQKRDWIENLTRDRVGVAGSVDESALRLARLVQRRGGRFGVFVTESRFVTGLGRSHPVENGFAWHPTLGTPYLPGSSVKGLVRSWLREQSPPRHDALDRLFGTPINVGGLCFLDAVPTKPVRLEIDVLTPHYANWAEDNPPGDWLSPTPIPFLVTAAGTPFLFAVVPRRDLRDDDLETAVNWLDSALTWAGAGAKTAVGYGRFRRDETETNRWLERLVDEGRQRHEAQAREVASATPEGRWRLEIQGRSEEQVLELVRVHLAKEPIHDPAEREAFVGAVQATGWPWDWRRGDKADPRTQLGKRKLKERARLLGEASAAEAPGPGPPTLPPDL